MTAAVITWSILAACFVAGVIHDHLTTPSPPTFECPRCGAVSHHPDDVRYGYCGRCHDYTRD